MKNDFPMSTTYFWPMRYILCVSLGFTAVRMKVNKLRRRKLLPTLDEHDFKFSVHLLVVISISRIAHQLSAFRNNFVAVLFLRLENDQNTNPSLEGFEI